MAGAWATTLPVAQRARLLAGMARMASVSRLTFLSASSADRPAAPAVVAWSVMAVTVAKAGGQEAVGPEGVRRLTPWVTRALAAMVPTGLQKSSRCSDEVSNEYESVCDSDVGD